MITSLQAHEFIERLDSAVQQFRFELADQYTLVAIQHAADNIVREYHSYGIPAFDYYGGGVKASYHRPSEKVVFTLTPPAFRDVVLEALGQ